MKNLALFIRGKQLKQLVRYYKDVLSARTRLGTWLKVLKWAAISLLTLPLDIPWRILANNIISKSSSDIVENPRFEKVEKLMNTVEMLNKEFRARSY